MSFFEKDQTAKGTGPKAATDSTEAAIAAAIKAASDGLLPPSVQLDPGVPDDSDWWKKFTSLTITTEGPVDGPNETATTQWGMRLVSSDEHHRALPAAHTAVFGAGAVPRPSLCDEVYEISGKEQKTFQGSYTKAQAVADRIKALESEIKEQRCPVACPDMRARVTVELSERGSSGDEINYSIKWWLRVYCFEEKNESRAP